MRKTILYIAISLDGKIAKADGSVDWLEAIPVPADGDYGYAAFYKSIDTTIQGNTTYQQIISWGVDFPYPEKKNYVITRKQGLANTEHVEFISTDPVTFLRELKTSAGKDIWIVGGGKLNATFLEAKLIDEIQVFIMPVVLTEGIDMFAALSQETSLSLVASKTYENGVVALTYYPI